MFRLISAYSKNSKYNLIHPMEKLILTIFPIVILGFTKSAIPLLINIAFFALLHLICKNPIKMVVKFAVTLTLFGLISTITFVFDYGVYYSLVVVLKTLSGAMALSFLALTTPIDHIFYFTSKMNWLSDITDIAKNMERFIVLIEDEYQIMYKAMVVRGGFGDFKAKIHDTGKLAGLLFVNSMNRWREIKDSIDARCSRGYMHYSRKDFRISLVRVLGCLGYCLGLVLLIKR
ncbi:cobalt ECF transporter T component CbiQ [Clostridium grantii]|uniref:Cobalt/nickel transport system permease protein n=1 Tax=Clostridium grantii DSM 8605 TaxID=1121316 RepID=A0A1M5V5F8_9CLOT|nr:cobalt ECF transporter T component CbiQ [Clostridium grantii]SHH70475.1 cobalt/nickel transport system permease protein [Clostridium grantii DSM 8605]